MCGRIMTRDEAEEQYARSKQSYYEAEQQRARLSNQIDNYREQKKYAAAQISSAKGEKTNFEKRLRGIESIIKVLEGSGWFSENAPQSISKANNALQSANNSYQNCIRLTNGTPPAADMEATFRAKSVEDDPNSSVALKEYHRERDRLEQAIIDLNNRINGCYAEMESLTKKISACSAEQSSARRIMMNSVCEMVRCKAALAF